MDQSLIRNNGSRITRRHTVCVRRPAADFRCRVQRNRGRYRNCRTGQTSSGLWAAATGRATSSPARVRPTEALDYSSSTARPRLGNVGVCRLSGAGCSLSLRVASRFEGAKRPRRGMGGHRRGVRSTGQHRTCLWDSDSQTERGQYASRAPGPLRPCASCSRRWMRQWDPHPLACRTFSESSLGVDVSAGAVERARHESQGFRNAEYSVAFGRYRCGRRKRSYWTGSAPANVFVRGVFHVLKPDRQAVLAANLHTDPWRKRPAVPGRTNFRGDSLGYLAELGATRANMPSQFQRALKISRGPGTSGRTNSPASFPRRQLAPDYRRPRGDRSGPHEPGRHLARRPRIFRHHGLPVTIAGTGGQ